mmetsp:Transcript_17372/g.17459  ORF Transcript_17372/g.17459 Transcript_17372/m.17459 type:complete len:318 (-) Transcript_17372:130-1083(-)
MSIRSQDKNSISLNGFGAQYNSSSMWHEFIKEHSRSKPIVPTSEFLISRCRQPDNEPECPHEDHSTERSEQFHSSLELKEKCLTEKKPCSKTVKQRFCAEPKYSRNNNLLQPPHRLVSTSASKHRSGTSKRRQAHNLRDVVTPGDKRVTDPLLWSLSSTPNDANITIHRPVTCGPGPKYTLEPVITRARRKTAEGMMNRSGLSCASVMSCGSSTFSTAERMPDELPRSPGPIFFPPYHKGAQNQQQMSTPKLHASGKHLLGSIYYDGFTSSGPSVMYDTTVHLSSESKRRSVPGVVVGRPSTTDVHKYPPLVQNSRQ